MGRSGLITVIGAIVIAAFAASRECGVRRTADQVFAEWMSRNCAVGERGVLELQLRRYSSRLEPRLEQAFLQGPPPAAKAQWLRVAQREREEVVAAINAGKTHGLSPDEISRLKARNMEGVSERDLDDLVESYRSAAMAGLVVIDTTSARQFLQSILRDPKQRDYWGAATLSLERSAPPRR